jgi:hypothetical protein
VLFARPRSQHVILQDIDRLRNSAESEQEDIVGLPERLVTEPTREVTGGVGRAALVKWFDHQEEPPPFLKALQKQGQWQLEQKCRRASLVSLVVNDTPSSALSSYSN